MKHICSVLLIPSLLLISVQTLSLTLTVEQKIKLLEYNRLCVAESGVQQKAMVDDANWRKYTGCLFKKIGIIDDDGNLQEDLLMSNFPADKASVSRLLAACKDTKGVDVDDTAYLLYMCFKENRKRSSIGL